MFGLVFGSLVAASALALSSYGPLPVVVTIAVIVMVFVGIGRGFRRSARTLDELVDAVARVEAGDYGMRVSVPDRGIRPVRQLTRGFNTMVERLERDEDQRRLREPRGDDRWRPPRRRGASGRDPRGGQGHGAAHR
jgi:methyl-accepting chemotaxis protein